MVMLGVHTLLHAPEGELGPGRQVHVNDVCGDVMKMDCALCHVCVMISIRVIKIK